MHNTGAVGIKLYTYDTGADVPTFSLNKTKVVNCTYAFQLGSGANLAPVLKDVQIDSCTNHTVPNLGSNSLITFINPDFTVIRQSSGSTGDLANICFRYSLFVGDASRTAVQNIQIPLLLQEAL